MNIIQAREAAMAGKTVIAPNGVEFIARDFSDDVPGLGWTHNMVFGEWSLKQEPKEPVVFETEVEYANHSAFGPGKGLVWSGHLRKLVGKKVRVTVEVIE